MTNYPAHLLYFAVRNRLRRCSNRMCSSWVGVTRGWLASQFDLDQYRGTVNALIGAPGPLLRTCYFREGAYSDK